MLRPFTAALLPFVDLDQSSSALTPGTPEQIAPGEQLGAHLGAADEAGHAGTPVDIDLTAMIILTRRPAHRLGRVLGAYGVDPVVDNTLRHQFDKIGPDPRASSGVSAHCPADADRSDYGTEPPHGTRSRPQTGWLGPSESAAIGRVAASDPAPRKIRIRVGAEWIGTEFAQLE